MGVMTKKYQLYIDETGNREPDAEPLIRQDGMNCFGLGGILIEEENIRDLLQKHKDFCSEWKIDYPLDEGTSGHYNPLVAKDYRRIVLGEPQRRTKNSPPIQIADLILYPMAKGGYDPDYYPYRKLKEAGKLIDCVVPKEDIPLLGIKYSCFDG